MKTKRMTVVLSLTLIVLFAFTVQVQAGRNIQTGPFPGHYRTDLRCGRPVFKGVEDYFKYVNDMKLLGDDKIDCTIRDDQYKTDVTKRNFEDFLDQGIVFYLNYSTGSTWP
jgi:branched-chain amino acid transport system substrate-binding protein